MRRFFSVTTVAVVLLSLLVGTALQSQEPDVGQYLIYATGSIHAEFAHYKEGADRQRKEVLARKWVFIGSGWAYRSDPSAKLSIWLTNAHVVEAPLAHFDNDGRAWVPTGRYGVRLQGKEIIPANRVVAKDRTKDLAALEVPISVQTVRCIQDGTVPEGVEVVNVGFPLGIRYNITYGRVMRADRDDYEQTLNKDQYKGGHLWLDIRATHGSSGSPVVALATGCLVGVIRGYWVAGAWFQMGEPMVYAIPNTTVQTFLGEVDGKS